MAIEIFPGAVQFEFSVDIAKETINSIKKEKMWQDSMLGGGRVAQHIRSSQSLNLDSYPVSQKIREYIYDSAKDYSQYYDIEIRRDEGLNVLRYNEYDKYEYHVDTGPEIYRTVSCLVYLNPSDYEGGGTHFKHFDYNINPKEPCLVLFPSNYPYLHAAMPVTSGTKYIIVTWMNDSIENLMGSTCSCAPN